MVSIDLAQTSISAVQQVTQSAEFSYASTYKHQLAPAKVDLDNSIGQLKPYTLGPQEQTLTLAGNLYSASFDQYSIGIKGGDILQRFDWQLNLGATNDQLSGASGDIRWQGWPLKVSAHVFHIRQLDELGANPFSTLNDATGGYIQTTYPWQMGALKVLLFGQANVNDGQQIKSQSVSLGWQQSWFHSRSSWAVFQKSQFQWLDGSNDITEALESKTTTDWDGFNAEFSIAGQFKDVTLEALAKRHRRFNSFVNIGGASSNLFNSKAHLNHVFTPELTFNQLATDDYRYFQMALSMSDGPAKLIYARHSLPAQPDIDVYGVKGQTKMSIGAVGLNDIVLDYGLLRVNSELDDSETEAWLGLRYQY